MTGKLAGRVALVFGAGSSQIGQWSNGKAAAVLYAREGAKVVAVDLRMDAAEDVRETIAQEGGDARAIQCDATCSESVHAAVAATLAAYGQIDVLHNNVGIAETGGPVETSEESWDRVMTTNVKSMFLACKHVLPEMERRRSGAIVNISSMSAIRWMGVPWIGYATSKSAINQFTRHVAMQYASAGIRANVVMPGLIDTPMARGYHSQNGASEALIKKERDARCPTGSQGDPWDVARASLFLASDDARYITGVLLPVDGGLSCAVQ